MYPLVLHPQATFSASSLVSQRRDHVPNNQPSAGRTLAVNCSHNLRMQSAESGLACSHSASTFDALNNNNVSCGFTGVKPASCSCTNCISIAVPPLLCRPWCRGWLQSWKRTGVLVVHCVPPSMLLQRWHTAKLPHPATATQSLAVVQLLLRLFKTSGLGILEQRTCWLTAESLQFCEDMLAKACSKVLLTGRSSLEMCAQSTAAKERDAVRQSLAWLYVHVVCSTALLMVVLLMIALPSHSCG